jgi:hypothetical protein
MPVISAHAALAMREASIRLLQREEARLLLEARNEVLGLDTKWWIVIGVVGGIVVLLLIFMKLRSMFCCCCSR